LPRDFRVRQKCRHFGGFGRSVPVSVGPFTDLGRAKSLLCRAVSGR
jgi:hypothetical protein